MNTVSGETMTTTQEKFIISCINLLNAVPVKKKTGSLNKDLIKHGYVVRSNVSECVKQVLISQAITLNKTFYQTWESVAKKTREEIFIDQIFHYMLGVVHENPNFHYDNKVFHFKHLECLKISEIKERVKQMVYQKVALKNETIADVFTILNSDDIDFAKIQNRDSKIYCHVHFKIPPRYPEEILKCAMYEAIGELSIIKSKDLDEKIKNGKVHEINKWFLGNEQFMATLFNRFKPVFMSIKQHNESLKPCINKISKLSKTHHCPMKQQKPKEPETGYEIVRHLKFILKNRAPTTYKIRNGKMWCTRDRAEEIKKYMDMLEKILPRSIKQSENTRLAVPTSEKNFSGPFPIGTEFSDKSLIVGIYWKGERVDLDLSSNSLSGKVGWNAEFNRNGIIYSGDITSAPNGANEYLQFNKITCPQVVLVNMYNGGGNESVDMKIIVARCKPNQDVKQNRIVDESQIIATMDTTSEKKQKVLGVVFPSEDGVRFVLIDKVLGKMSKVGNWDDDSSILIEAFSKNNLYLDEYCKVDSKSPECDLSNESLSKDKMLNLFN
ncbi:164L [Cherax quadricarinatus iridovirus]|uniref:Uncharacterized protein n=1 Tax=Shrimp hemocyte iridescent virus TaxID=2039780 RepID=A0A291B0Z5_9VIRU|nr:164L [Cherax quadricarinatus iridovirus]YP_010084915.1 hypothetical protein KM509_gp163 [Shrimp hemocyte iridescent virus]UPA43308.1 hypothetical protein 4TH000034 [Iridovirus CN01]ASZ85144.1 164L [Cherax quadricarinatus iridovirus]ATE87172.1 hypothetical protein [Shrimp hemocyte iridescent virus]UPA43543.1 hypothetical protein 3TG000110 [Iridovirus CN01]UPA43740.1 hypothetical protein 1DG000148 [Iridovirus CN01]